MLYISFSVSSRLTLLVRARKGRKKARKERERERGMEVGREGEKKEKGEEREKGMVLLCKTCVPKLI